MGIFPDITFRMTVWDDEKREFRIDIPFSSYLVSSKNELQHIRRHFDQSALDEVIRNHGGVYGLRFGPRLIRLNNYSQWAPDGSWVDDEMFPPHPIEIFAMTQHEFNKERERNQEQLKEASDDDPT